jgi:nitrite reductase/ring-hydroxylating ferredoxin subunit
MASTPQAAHPVQLAGAYHRRVHASLRRIWENVHDWEHLAHLHDGSFAACDLIERGPWGWRARLKPARGGEQVIELRAEPERNRYTSTTLEGPGTGTEIRVALRPVAEHLTDVEVEFHLPEPDSTRLRALGDAYAAVYATLWDEDEAMMRERERALALPRPSRGPHESLDLGPEADVRAVLPLTFDYAGRPFRLVELDGALVAHATLCPHWLGPLGDAPVEDGQVRCPWHGYRFDVRSGACTHGGAYRLQPPPAIAVIDGRVVAAQAG